MCKILGNATAVFWHVLTYIGQNSNAQQSIKYKYKSLLKIDRAL